ncbi:hypothetical protein CLOSYM_02305 [[Clostridium] symbiosum ATCC 14940]|uniref:Uncharacterized protein n=1 Tax=[Clostridium] symbiosum ATCC 14940 TaxID=411472 RepID=A0ABC9TXY1_CLOSY|nr:hypothetical protein CLOSYM_02305 [[Clostridium] symbiosum ATCC 14940]
MRYAFDKVKMCLLRLFDILFDLPTAPNIQLNQKPEGQYFTYLYRKKEEVYEQLLSG